ncbi:spermidine synthase [Cellulosimicrobium marinum]|uniref:spermidine synthase n=1 Tax=Cellulosimicrobium marinum TaxID=1638992 RepID=UPI001E5BE21E|nr:fused MFS/spermidine synthase [Cellulosimicrobium marinum]MCB7137769.1 fused MFS/spermidine synthase [Cellulosimicrobium marinum]
MARRSRRPVPGSTTPPTPGRRRGPAAAPALPDGPVPIATGTARVEADPDAPRAVTLYVNGVPSSHLDLDDPGFLGFEYMQQMAAVVDLLPAGPLRVLHLGAAGCSLARWVEHTRPGSAQVGVDLDARLLELVREWFALPRSPRLRLRTGDARAVLESFGDASFDVVVRDVFAGDATPEHLTTAGTAAAVRRVLRPGGIYLVNCADRPPLGTVRRELATLALVSADDRGGASTPYDARLAVLAEPGQLKGRRYGNLVLAASRPGERAPDLAGPALARAARALPQPASVLVGHDLAAFVGTARPIDDPPAPARPDDVPDPSHAPSRTSSPPS